MKQVMKKLKDLIIDKKLTELRPIDFRFVNRYRHAYRMGSKFPPPIIEEGTNRIVSGNTRVTAMLEEYGEEREIPVIVKKFANETEVLKEFARENVTHGNPLSVMQRDRIALALLEMGEPEEKICFLLNIPSINRLEKAGDRLVAVIGENGTEKHEMPKPGLKINEPITEAQYREHRGKDLPVGPGKLIEQLIRWFKNDWISANDGIKAVLVELRNQIDAYLKRVTKAA